MRHVQPLENNIQKHLGSDGECILWLGALNEAGYGVIRHGRKLLKVHREVYMAKHGRLHRDIVVKHSCNKRHCCNLEHLFTALRSDMTKNIAHSFKLNELQVREARERFSNGFSMGSIARSCGVSYQAISKVLRYETWKEIA